MKLARSCAMVAATLITTLTWAADLETTTKEKTPRFVPSPSWWESITLDGSVEGGAMINFDNPIDGLNFGHLYTDRHATPTLNQAILTIQRPLDHATDYEIGFKIQWMYGSDVRYTPFLGELDYAINARRQITVNEAYAQVHIPLFTHGGVEVKFGQFVTLLGLEQITAIDNPFYSHAYMYRFGVPFNHTGVLTTTRVFPWLAIHAGVTTGVNTSIGWPGDNNSAAAFLGGFGLTFLKGDLLINGSTHIGPEIPKQLDPLGVGCGPGASWAALRQYAAAIPTTRIAITPT